MKSDARYCAQMLQSVVGAKIVAIVESEDGDDYSFGLRIKKGKTEEIIWIDRDAECNSPGFAKVEPVNGG